MTRITALDPAQFYLARGYVQRDAPEYFVDENDAGVVWQPDVYPYTASVARAHGRTCVIDLGCGRARKLVNLRRHHPDLDVVGVDYGANIAWCQRNLLDGLWLEADLETATTLRLDPARIARSVVVCCDVLEHLVDPQPAMRLIEWLLRAGAARAVLSTPARDRRAGAEHLGPPYNPSHVREWTCEEFQFFVGSCGLEVERFELTRSDNAGGGLTTQLAVVRLRGASE